MYSFQNFSGNTKRTHLKFNATVAQDVCNTEMVDFVTGSPLHNMQLNYILVI